jgi:hypothetical protein
MHGFVFPVVRGMGMMTGRARVRTAPHWEDRMFALRIAVLVAVAAIARPAAAGFDLTIDAVFTQSFTPDLVVDFEAFAIGEILESGDPVAEGITFGGAADTALQPAIVVDTGGGNRALRQINLGTPLAPVLTEIAFTFAPTVRSVGAQADAFGDSPGGFFPLAEIFEPSADILGFVSVGGSVNSFFGFQGESTSTPIGILVYSYADGDPATGMTIDDLALQYVPEAGAAGATLAALAGIAGLSPSSRRA